MTLATLPQPAAANHTQRQPGGIWALLSRAATAPAVGVGDVWRGLERRMLEQRPTTIDQRPSTNDQHLLTNNGDGQQPADGNLQSAISNLQSASLWQYLAEQTDPASYKPCAIADVAEEQVHDGEQTLTVIRSPRGNYLQLTAIQREIWHQMDGSRSAAQLATQALLKHKQLVLVPQLVAALHDEGFLIDQPVGVYRRLSQALEARTAEGFGRRVLRVLTSSGWHFPAIDGFYSRVYTWGGKLLFSWPFAVIWAVVALAGLGLFLGLLLGNGPPVFSGGGAAVPFNLLALWLCLLVSFLLHESAHALAVKHFGRTLRGGGLMLYFGMPAFFVDTSDIWRSPRRARVLVSAAGPMSDLFIGALAAGLAWWAPTSWAAPIAIKLAFTCYLATLINLNPLLELDGYYILVDLLRLPDLRRRALAFVRGPLWGKFETAPTEDGRQKTEFRIFRLPLIVIRPFSRDERIFTIYGLLTLLYSLVAIGLAWQFWNRQLLGTILRLWEGGEFLGQLAAAALFLLVVVPIVAGLVLAGYGVGRAGLGWVIARGYGRQPALLAAVALGLSLGATLLVTQVNHTAGATITLLLWAIALGALAALRPDYRGAAIAPALSALLVTTALGGLSTAVQVLLQLLPPVIAGRAETALLLSPLWTLADGLAFVCMLWAAFAILLDVNLRAAPPRELLFSAVLMMIACLVGGVALFDVIGALPGWPRLAQLATAAPAYFGAVALALMLPFLLALYDSRLVWSWGLLWLALLTETAAYVFDLRQLALRLGSPGQGWALWPDALAAALWASAWLVHLATLRQITPEEMRWQHVASLNEGGRLSRAFQMTYAGCYRLLRAVYGSRRTQELDDRMDVYAATANWDVTLDREQARIGQAVLALPLEAQGNRFAEVLRYTVATIEALAGAAFARRAIQAAYDALPWPERETAGRLCFPATPWAQVLSEGFGAARSARLRMLRQIDLFLTADDDELETLAHSIEERQVPAGTLLLRAGEHPAGMWVVEAGEVIAFSETQAELEIHRGDAFGAAEISAGSAAGLSYQASLATSLLFIPAGELQRLLQRHAPDSDAERETLTTLRLLERVPIFADVPRHTLRGLAQLAELRQFAARSLIVREGLASGMLYIVREGQAAVLARSNGAGDTHGPLRVVAQLGPEEFFGELELLRGTPPVASVAALTSLTVLALPHAAIQALLLGDGAMARSLEQVGTGRLMALRGQNT